MYTLLHVTGAQAEKLSPKLTVNFHNCWLNETRSLQWKAFWQLHQILPFDDVTSAETFAACLPQKKMSSIFVDGCILYLWNIYQIVYEFFFFVRSLWGFCITCFSFPIPMKVFPLPVLLSQRLVSCSPSGLPHGETSNTSEERRTETCLTQK